MSALNRSSNLLRSSLFRSGLPSVTSPVAFSARRFSDGKDDSRQVQSQSQSQAQRGDLSERNVNLAPRRSQGSVRGYDPFADFFMDSPRTGADWPFFADRFMDKQFKNMLAPFRTMFRDLETGFDVPSVITSWLPRADITETEDAYLVHAELPGVPKENMKVEFDNGILTIRGERRESREDEEKGGRRGTVYRRERMYGTFERSFQLPKNVQPKDIQASYKDGVLEIRIPKKDKQVQNIEVKEANKTQ